MDSKIVGKYLEVIRLARTIGHNLCISKEIILTEVQEVASSNRFARSITFANAMSVRKVSCVWCLLLKRK